VICGKYLAKRMKEEKRLKRTGFSPSALPIDSGRKIENTSQKPRRGGIFVAPEGRHFGSLATSHGGQSPVGATFSNDVTGENKEQE
jgi:hypothetical protein